MHKYRNTGRSTDAWADVQTYGQTYRQAKLPMDSERESARERRRSKSVHAPCTASCAIPSKIFFSTPHRQRRTCARQARVRGNVGNQKLGPLDVKPEVQEGSTSVEGEVADHREGRRERRKLKEEGKEKVEGGGKGE
eukprot:754425-Hanusia_phi.AAC.1